MDVGAFTSGLLTGLREGVEAALILAIICAYLAKTGNRRYFPTVFAGAGLALGLSAILGIILFALGICISVALHEAGHIRCAQAGEVHSPVLELLVAEAIRERPVVDQCGLR